ncbi:MAG: hypothetical protein NVS2B7_16960 [Herpetosiphon sp.]
MLVFKSRPRRTVMSSIGNTAKQPRSIRRLTAGLLGATTLAVALTLPFNLPSHTSAQSLSAPLALLGSTSTADAPFETTASTTVQAFTRTYTAPTDSGSTVTVNVGVAMLRSGPSTDNRAVGRLYEGTTLTVLTETDGWFHVRTPRDHVGWVSADLVTVDNTTDPTNDTQRIASATGVEIARYARRFVGAPYRYGASGPRAFDCSGLTRWVYGQFGIDIPHMASEQWGMSGLRIRSVYALQPGDLVFFANTAGPGISHVALYVGNGRMVTANSRSTGVQISTITDSYWMAHWAGGLRIA